MHWVECGVCNTLGRILKESRGFSETPPRVPSDCAVLKALRAFPLTASVAPCLNEASGK